MLDNSRLKTGYDIEVLLGSDYFLRIFIAAFESGEIPSELELGESLVLQLSAPTKVVINETLTSNIEVTLPVRIVLNGVVIFNSSVIIFCEIRITETKIYNNYARLDDSTKNMILDLETATSTPGILEKVENELRTSLKREMALRLSTSASELFLSKVVTGSGDYQDAFGLYINLRFDKFYGNRGTLSQRVSFLPENKSFAIGICKNAFDLLEKSMWNSIEEEPHPVNPESNYKPIKQNGTVLGYYDDLNIYLWYYDIGPVDPETDHPTTVEKDGLIRIKLDLRVYSRSNYIPNADAVATFHITPFLEDGTLMMESKLKSFSVDSGILGDLYTFFIGVIVGALLGSISGPAGAALGAAIGGVGGVFVMEIAEDVVEDLFAEDVEDAGLKKINSVTDLLGSPFPPRTKAIAEDETDPFYTKRFDLLNYLDELLVDKKGMSYCGRAIQDIVNVPEEVDLIDKTRGEGSESWNGLQSLTYRTIRGGDIVLPIQEVLSRIPEKKIRNVPLKATQIHRYESVIEDIKFENGLDLHVDESLVLQFERISHVLGYRVISRYQRRDGKWVSAHYRAFADSVEENNFESLPSYEPEA